MYTGKVTSLKEILWKVTRVAPDISYEDAAEYAIEAIRLIGAPLSYENKTTKHVEVVNNKAAMPVINWVEIRGIRKIENIDNYEEDWTALTHATDIYHSSEDCEPQKEDFPNEYTYTIRDGVIQTSFTDGYIQISYKAMMTDDDGYPLIQDNQKNKFAIEYFILWRHMFPLFIAGKITDKAYRTIEQLKHWYMGAANTSLALEGIDHLESTMNGINRLLVRSNAHAHAFKEDSLKERLQRYS